LGLVFLLQLPAVIFEVLEENGGKVLEIDENTYKVSYINWWTVQTWRANNMKSFYEMLRILESEQVKTPGGYSLTPEELEGYENERSSMYKALFLKDIDAKRKAEEERSPERVTAKEAERKRQEDEKIRQKKELKEKELKEKERTTENKSPRQKYDYVIKASGLLLNELPNKYIEGVMLSLGIKKENLNWMVKTHLGNFSLVPYDGPMEEPKEDRDYEFVQRLLNLLILEWKNLYGYDYITGEWNPLNIKEDHKIIENVFKKIGVERTGEIGEYLNFNGIYHDTISDAEVGQKVIVRVPGFIFRTPRGPIILSKSIVEPA